jgi:uncharacterized hydrophobic protein (TIGR00271 family)
MNRIVLVYDSKAEDQVEKTIVPGFGPHLVLKIPFSNKLNLEVSEAGLVVAYLSDDQLKQLFYLAKGKKFGFGILPHPELIHGLRGFGVKGEIEANIAHILKAARTSGVDVLNANGMSVFNTIIIGESLSLMSGSIARFRRQRFWERTGYFFKLFWHTKLSSFTIKARDQEEIKTAAIGLIIVHHAQSSLLSQRLLDRSVINDGKLHALILAPKSISGLFYFVLSSLFRTRGANKLPLFAAHIKTSSLLITSEKPLNYSQDGILLSTKKLNLEIQQKALRIIPGENLNMEGNGGGDDVFKIEVLPRGEVRDELLKRNLPLINHATTEEFKDLFSNLRESAQTTNVYLVLMLLSTFIATLGLFGNSSPVIIGAMILAPLMAPIISLSMGVLRQDQTLILNSSKTIGWGVLLGYLCAIIITWLTPLNISNDEILARVRPNLLDLGIAVASGIAGAYASAKTEISKTLAGVAIAVALVPPLAVSGIGVGWMDWDIFRGAFLLFLTNLAGMVMSAAITFLLLGFSPFRLARRGLVYSLIVVILVSLPLFFGFVDMVREKDVIAKLDGYQIEGVILRDITVRNVSPIRLTLKIVTEGSLGKNEMENIKTSIEKIIGEEVELEVTMAVKIY